MCCNCRISRSTYLQSGRWVRLARRFILTRLFPVKHICILKRLVVVGVVPLVHQQTRGLVVAAVVLDMLLHGLGRSPQEMSSRLRSATVAVVVLLLVWPHMMVRTVVLPQLGLL